MEITDRINTDSPIGKELEDELSRYPESVEFVDSNIVSDTTPIAYISVKKGFEQVREDVKSISASESAKLAFHKLGEKYNRTFDNKYTR